MEKATTKVPFTTAEVGSCMCPKCPVQAASACVKGKVLGIQGALKKNPLQRADIPGAYCSTGTATCRDLDPSKSCVCGTCSVFTKYSLAGGTPVGYYCRDGNAK
jgi:hypothetical protein